MNNRSAWQPNGVRAPDPASAEPCFAAVDPTAAPLTGPVEASPRAATKEKIFYQPELDCLRFFAFFGVFCYHCVPRPDHSTVLPHVLASVIVSTLQAGAFGVPVFFALSAYLITNLLLREKENRGFVDTRSFYIRRILRIWPLYFSFVAVAAVIPLFVSSQHLPFSYVAGYALLAGNWIYVFLGNPASVAGPLWSVSIEEQFYLTWPLVMRRASRRGLATIAGGLLVAANASRVLLALEHSAPRVATFNTISCIDPIALGVLLAVAFKKPVSLGGVKRVVLFLFSAAVMVNAARSFDFGLGWQNSIGRALVSFASIGILVSFAGSTNKLIRSGTFVYLGKISYGLYVTHLFGWICAVAILRESAARSATLAGGLELAALAFVLTILIAAASYHWLESPFLRLKERFTYVHSRPV